MKLDISALIKALARLNEAVGEHRRETENQFVKDSVVKRFEYTYELSHKMLRRFLALTEFNDEAVNEMTFFDIIRTGNAKGLLQGEVEDWNEYRKMRNTTSHTYEESKADEVIAIVPKFVGEADYLVKRLQERLAKIK